MVWPLLCVMTSGQQKFGPLYEILNMPRSILSLLLFVVVLEALSKEFREVLPMELLYGDDLVLVSETKELPLDKLGK